MKMRASIDERRLEEVWNANFKIPYPKGKISAVVLGIMDFLDLIDYLESKALKAIKEGEMKEYGSLLKSRGYNTEAVAFMVLVDSSKFFRIAIKEGVDTDEAILHELNHIREWGN